jgi:hypothetical protein
MRQECRVRRHQDLRERGYRQGHGVRAQR